MLTPHTSSPTLSHATSTFADLGPTGVAPGALAAALDRHERSAAPRYRSLWAYYRNPAEHLGASAGQASRTYRLAQERGLPARITGGRGTSAFAASALAGADRPWARKEVVIENDIAWRIHTMVDFMFGRRIALRSQARDPALRAIIERTLDAIWDSSGGLGLLQDAGLLGHVYGHVDLIVRAAALTDGSAPPPTNGGGSEAGQGTTPRGSVDTTADGTAAAHPAAGTSAEALTEAARRSVRIEVVEPTRGVALLAPDDYRQIGAFVLRYQRQDIADPRGTANPDASPSRLGRLVESLVRSNPNSRAATGMFVPTPGRTTITEVLGPRERRVYATDARGRTRLVESGPSLVAAARANAGPEPLEPPVAHIQNLSQPFAYDGLSEVEPLIPLQDELNTRLSDRASRVTMSAFRMYLAKGLDSADKLPVAPGIVWSTDNMDADVRAFGGDQASPSEERHIDEIREALDKQSGVPPLAAGVVRAKIGNLSSETALRLTLSGLLSKTARKRITYGRGIARASALALEALDALGILKTDPADRAVLVHWPEPLPRDERDVLDSAQRKLDLGVPRERILAELGYAPEQAGEV